MGINDVKSAPSLQATLPKTAQPSMEAVDVEVKIKKYDSDGDGKVTQDEFRAGKAEERAQSQLDLTEDLFDKHDADGNGKLSAEELKKVVDQDVSGLESLNRGGVLKKLQEKGSKNRAQDAQMDDFLFGKLDADPADKASQPFEEGWKGEFSEADATKNGKLSGTEIKKEYKAYDKNGDGKLTLNEFLAGKKAEVMAELKKKAEADFKGSDINEDGVLDGIETEGLGYDSDKDAEITKEEYSEGYLKDPKKIDDFLKGKEIDANKDLFKYDVDGDGKATMDELKAILRDDKAAKAFMGAYDLNKDGVISLDPKISAKQADLAKRIDEKAFEMEKNRTEIAKSQASLKGGGNFQMFIFASIRETELNGMLAKQGNEMDALINEAKGFGENLTPGLQEAVNAVEAQKLRSKIAEKQSRIAEKQAEISALPGNNAAAIAGMETEFDRIEKEGNSIDDQLAQKKRERDDWLANAGLGALALLNPFAGGGAWLLRRNALDNDIRQLEQKRNYIESSKRELRNNIDAQKKVQTDTETRRQQLNAELDAMKNDLAKIAPVPPQPSYSQRHIMGRGVSGGVAR